jgi:Pyruvate/2-oxoacid:ferredoxin oxidoreductase delta subunit/flavodoxin
MKTILYYFSGTGNTLMLARLLAEQLGNTEIINIVSCKSPTPPPEADAIGILFPVYVFSLPKIVHDFIKNDLNINEDTYIFALTNYASSGGGSALKQLNALLKRKKRKLKAGFGLNMPSSYIPFGGAESQKKQNRCFLRASERIKVIARRVKEHPENYSFLKSRIPLFISKIFYLIFIKIILKNVKKNYVNDSCKGCGNCTKICPRQNIKLIDKRPSWGTHCEQCMACLQWCPETAIQRRGVPETRLRYHNPGILAEDLIKDIHK